MTQINKKLAKMLINKLPISKEAKEKALEEFKKIEHLSIEELQEIQEAPVEIKELLVNQAERGLKK